MNLADTPFQKIKAGTKVVESRLYDEKRQLIELGDEIMFSSHESGSVSARVVALLRYPTFQAMFSDFGPTLFGGDSVDALTREIKQFYSNEDETKYGVVGIKLELILRAHAEGAIQWRSMGKDFIQSLMAAFKQLEGEAAGDFLSCPK